MTYDLQSCNKWCSVPGSKTTYQGNLQSSFADIKAFYVLLLDHYTINKWNFNSIIRARVDDRQISVLLGTYILIEYHYLCTWLQENQAEVVSKSRNKLHKYGDFLVLRYWRGRVGSLKTTLGNDTSKLFRIQLPHVWRLLENYQGGTTPPT